MIVHLAPRRVALVSKGDKTGIPIDLNTVLAVSLQVGLSGQVAVVVRLTNQERMVAGVYRTMAEAGPDCGRLRVLAGLPASAATDTVPGPLVQPRTSRTLSPARLLIAGLATLIRAAGWRCTLSSPA